MKSTQAGQTPIHSALMGGALSEVAKSRPKLDYNSLGSEGDRTLEYYAAPFYRNLTPLDAGSRIRLLPFGLCHTMPRSCISAKPVGRLLRNLRRATFSLPNFSFTGSYPECITRRHAPLDQGISVRPALGATVCCSFGCNTFSLAVQSFIGTLSPRHTHHPNAWCGKLIILPLKIFAASCRRFPA